MAQKVSYEADIILKAFGEEDLKNKIKSIKYQLDFLREDAGKLFSFASKSTNFSGLTSSLEASLNKLNAFKRELSEINSKEGQSDFLRKNIADINNLEISLKGLKKELFGTSFKDYENKLQSLNKKYDNLIFSLEKLKVTQSRWTSGKNIQQTNQLISSLIK